MSKASELALIRRAAMGDVPAFGELVRLYQGFVYNVALRVLGQRQEAEDAAQETFLRAYRAFATFDVNRPLEPWLRRICVNVCRNWFAAQKIRPATPVTDIGRAEREADMDDWILLQPTPEQVVAAAEQAAGIRLALQQLPPNYRLVIELRHFGDLSYEEMALQLNRSLSNVKSDLFRARRRLGQLLTEKMPQEMETGNHGTPD